jgi:hypothetical protein
MVLGSIHAAYLKKNVWIQTEGNEFQFVRKKYKSQPTENRIKIRVTLWLAVYLQSVHLGAKPLEAHDQRFLFATEPLKLQSICNILSNENMCLSLMNRLGVCQVYVSHI